MSSFGFNAGFVDEMFARYLEDPSAVSESWREFFADYRPLNAVLGARQAIEAPSGDGEGKPAVLRPAEPVEARREAPAVVPTTEVEEGAEPLRGIAGKIAENMAASLSVPTATSVRTIPVKLLEENRRLINNHQAATHGPKVSFTHVIAWAILRAIEQHPGMNAAYAEKDGKPHRVPRSSVNLGVAIDIERKGERVLLVPNIKDAGRLDFPSFVAAYDDVVARARGNKLNVDEFQSTTVSITNPGMIGTELSVPRLMAGQGAIFGIGAIGLPPEYMGMSPEVVSELGLSKTMTVTSTYDHRVIQGAESGGFLKTLERLLLGGDGFYQRIFRDLAIPNEPLAWAGDRNPEVFGGTRDLDAIRKQAYVLQLIRVHRVRGHLYANLDPLSSEPPQLDPELELSKYGLTVWDLDRQFMPGELAGRHAPMPLREILEIVRDTYCRHIGVEYMHIPFPEQRNWLQVRMESTRNAEPLTKEQQRRILEKLNAAEAFERFLHTTYVGHKRFSLEGAETLIPMLDFLLEDAATAGVEHAIIGMAHRGRLNVLANVVGKAHETIFREFEGDETGFAHGSGDVKYHLGAQGTHATAERKTLEVYMASNPSHLEAVDPVVEGMARALQDAAGDFAHARTLPILLHGDSAFAGQGVVAETFAMSQLTGYRTGGTVHIVVNNQIGFTTGPKDARSSLYATDVAKSVHAPIFHVNGDHPEDAIRVIRLAFAFRQQFKRDVVIDLVCYRRWGHNEGDEPSYTHPVLYQRIEQHRSVRKLYTEQLLRRGDMDGETAERALDHFRAQLQQIHDAVKRAAEHSEPTVAQDREAAEGVGVAPAQMPDTSAPPEQLERVLEGLARSPENFQPHPKLVRTLSQRRERYASGRVDWSLAEALAFGSLVLDGTPVRLSGEDSGRGTFSQRHAILYDYRTSAPYVPLQHLDPAQAPFLVYDSLLSEFAVLGFEYGYSVNRPEALVLWEAQFGDFVNGAQPIIDQFIASAEEKWGQRCTVVLLLPHGFEGQGPEHSSARIERFLQLAAAGNMRVTYPTTPAQYFHLLRRQVVQEPRKPLVVFTPKSLLRHPEAVSKAEELTQSRFQPVLADPTAPDAAKVRRVVLCSGKVYYDLAAHRRDKKLDEVAILRLEQYYPFPAHQLTEALAPYEVASDVVWVQEEPRNMGAWDFLDERLRSVLERGQTLRYVGRAANSSPATGSHKRHVAEQQALVGEALEGSAPAVAQRGQGVEAGARHAARRSSAALSR